MLPDREVESQGWPSKDLTRKNEKRKKSFIKGFEKYIHSFIKHLKRARKVGEKGIHLRRLNDQCKSSLIKLGLIQTDIWTDRILYILALMSKSSVQMSLCSPL